MEGGGTLKQKTEARPEVRRCGCSTCAANAPAGRNFVIWTKINGDWMDEFGEYDQTT